MGSRIDEFSHALGAIQEAVKGLAKSLDQDREVANDRHQENVGQLQQVHSQLTTLSLDVAQDRAVTAQVVASATLDRARVDKKLDEIESDVAELKTFKDWLSAKLAIATAIVMGGFYIVWSALTYFSAEVRGWVGRLFG